MHKEKLNVAVYVYYDGRLEIFEDGILSTQYFDTRTDALMEAFDIRNNFIKKGYQEDDYDFSWDEGKFMEIKLSKLIPVEYHPMLPKQENIIDKVLKIFRRR